jgi:23S rRNA (uridine2552-2'-O)-methyltransferase
MGIKDKLRVDDHYSQKARLEGYPARSVYKLMELDQKYGLISPEKKVLDLGCAPGSWTKYASEKIGPKGAVVGIDLLLPKEKFPSNVELISLDLLGNEPEILAHLGFFDLVMSDLAPKTCGHKDVDQAKSLELCQRAWIWARKLLVLKGSFLFKIFESNEAELFIKELSPFFSRQIRLKPKATRSKSMETFILGLGFSEV